MLPTDQLAFMRCFDTVNKRRTLRVTLSHHNWTWAARVMQQPDQKRRGKIDIPLHLPHMRDVPERRTEAIGCSRLGGASLLFLNKSSYMACGNQDIVESCLHVRDPRLLKSGTLGTCWAEGEEKYKSRKGRCRLGTSSIKAIAEFAPEKQIRRSVLVPTTIALD
jgi:hypothetical protein